MLRKTLILIEKHSRYSGTLKSNYRSRSPCVYTVAIVEISQKRYVLRRGKRKPFRIRRRPVFGARKKIHRLVQRTVFGAFRIRREFCVEKSKEKKIFFFFFLNKLRKRRVHGGDNTTVNFTESRKKKK